MTDRELLEQWLRPGAIVPVTMEATRILVEALRAALAQPEPEELGEIVPADEEQIKRIAKLVEQEPVAYDINGATVYIKPPVHNGKYLTGYTAPPQREFIGLTDEEIEKLYLGSFDEGQFARAIEAKLKEKNNG